MESQPPLETLLFSFILDQHARHRATNQVSPLIVGLQGPQGCGKTTITKALQARLSSGPWSLNTAVVSLDDFYLPHFALAFVASQHADNPLLQGRGQPGTHDVDKAQETLQAIATINSEGGRALELPVFDKSLYHGEGDRVAQGGGPMVQPPVQVVILEGWCLGFYPLADFTLKEKYQQLSSMGLGFHIALDSIGTLNDYLGSYTKLYPYLNAFIQIQGPPQDPYGVIYRWRLEQEHNMKEANGGYGMTDIQVKRFVERYVPGYLLFADGISLGYNTVEGEKIQSNYPPWYRNLLQVQLDEFRNLIGFRRP